MPETVERQALVASSDEGGVLAQFIHELSSPLSLLWTGFDGAAREELTVQAGAERVRQLLNYASATLVAEPLPVAQVPLSGPLRRAAQRLRKGSVCLGEIAAGLGETAAVLPADPVWAEVLMAGWLEAACYGAPAAPISVTVNDTQQGMVVLTAQCAAMLHRDPRLILRRLAVRAASHLAEMCGGGLVVCFSELKAVLALPKALPAPRAGVRDHWKRKGR
jgi:hypothetical protein